MKQVSVDKCPAGSAIDLAVATKLGWERVPGEYDHYLPPDFNMPVLKAWSTDIEDAWELVEESDLFADSYLTKNEDGKYVICSKHIGLGEWPEYYEGADENIALVISRTFLKAKGVAFVEIPE